MTYVDAFVVPLPKKNLKAYLAMSRKMKKVWLDHGAVDYHEIVGDDVKPGKLTSFPQSVKLKAGEVVVIGYITYKSRASRDKINAKAMKDERLASVMDPSAMPFDGKRMIYGGFKSMI